MGLVALLLLAAAAIFVFVPFASTSLNNLPEPVTGDPDAIVLRQEPGTGPALRYGDVPIYDACSLVTIAGLESLGMTLSRDYNIGHDHLDADVPPATAITPGGGDPISNCFYMLDSDDSLHVDVYQTPFNSPEDLRARSTRATFARAQVRSAADLSLASWHDDKYESEHLLLWRPELVVEISIRSSDSTGTLDVSSFVPKLESLVQSGIAAGPTAPMRHLYNSPLDKVKDPCTVAGRDPYALAFPSHTGIPAMVKASYTLDAPLAEATNARNGTISCRRNNIVPQGVLNKEQYRVLEVELSVWDKQTGATTRNSTSCAPFRDKIPVPVTPSIGSGKTCLADYTTDWVFMFQVDNVNVSVRNGDTGPKPDASVRLDQLLPAAQSIAAAGLFR